MVAAQLLDVLLALTLAAYLGEGWRNGILRSIGAFIGLMAGGVAAFFAVPALAAAIPAPEWRLTASITLGIALLVLGHLLGVTLASAARGRRPDDGGTTGGLGTGERLLGAGANLVGAALVLSLVAGSVADMGVPVISQAVKRSTVLSTIDKLTPAPIESALAWTRARIFESDSATVAEDLGGITGAQEPPSVDTATNPLAAAAQSVARINGTAFACGQNQTGSGFVVAPERIVTNAHVVAGVTNPVVELPDGDVLDATVVYFDPDVDVAILAVDGLTASPLRTTDAVVGDTGVVNGYPHGGPFQSTPAEVRAVSVERVADVYNASVSPRDVLTLAADIQPGNSGGPFLTTRGEVAGLVFARNSTHANIGYATTTTQLEDVYAAAAGLTRTVDSGTCVSE